MQDGLVHVLHDYPRHPQLVIVAAGACDEANDQAFTAQLTHLPESKGLDQTIVRILVPDIQTLHSVVQQ